MARANRDVAPVADSALALERRALGTSKTASIGDPAADTFVYVVAGRGSITLGETCRLEPRSATLVPAREEAEIAADDALELIVMTVGSDVDYHAPMGPRARTASIAGGAAQHATGARSFEILFDASNGSTRATLFAGFVPPGKAPWHYHLYDEIVWVPEGTGRLHVGDAVEELGAGSAFRLRPREVHIVENTSPDRELTIIGIFTPAGSPSAAYLPGDADTEYRVAG